MTRFLTREVTLPEVEQLLFVSLLGSFQQLSDGDSLLLSERRESRSLYVRQLPFLLTRPVQQCDAGRERQIESRWGDPTKKRRTVNTAQHLKKNQFWGES